MPQSSPYWAGYPRHKLPRIRSSSISKHNKNRMRSLGDNAARDVLRFPLGPELDKARQQQRLKTAGQQGRFHTDDQRLPVRGPPQPPRSQTTTVHSPSLTHFRKASNVAKGAITFRNGSGGLFEASEAVRQSTLEAPFLPTVYSSIKPSELSTRVPRRHKALKKFARDLQRHLVAQQALETATLLSSHFTSPGLSSSQSCYSIRTLIDFLPYLEEFNSAGLAVTSAQQHRYPDNKQMKNRPRKYSRYKNYEGKSSSHQRSLGKTKEVPLDIEALVSADESEKTSIGSTVITFTAPYRVGQMSHDMSMAPAERPAARKILPWLKSTKKPANGVSSVVSVATDTTTIINFEPHPNDSASETIWTDVQHLNDTPETITTKTASKNSSGISFHTINGAPTRSSPNSDTKKNLIPIVPPRPRTLQRPKIVTSTPKNDEVILQHHNGVAGRTVVKSTNPSSYSSDAIVEQASEMAISPVSPTSRYGSIPTGDGGRSIAVPHMQTLPLRVSQPAELDSRAFIRRSLGFNTASRRHGSLKSPSYGRRASRHSHISADRSPTSRSIQSSSSLPSCKGCGAEPVENGSGTPQGDFLHCSKCDNSKAKARNDDTQSPVRLHSIVSSTDDHASQVSGPYGNHRPSIFEQMLQQVSEAYQAPQDRMTQTGASLGSITDMSPQPRHSLRHPNKLTTEESSVPPIIPTPTTLSQQTLQSTSVTASTTSTSSLCASTLIPSTVECHKDVQHPREHISSAAVLCGLKIALAASLDKKVDRWIQEVSSTGVRKFFADLSKIDALGVNDLSRAARKSQHEKRTRKDISRARHLPDSVWTSETACVGNSHISTDRGPGAAERGMGSDGFKEDLAPEHTWSEKGKQKA